MLGNDLAGQSLADIVEERRRQHPGAGTGRRSDDDRRLSHDKPASPWRTACSMHQRGSANARRSPNSSTSEMTEADVEAVPRRPVGVPDDHEGGDVGGRGEGTDPADDLAVETLGVEVALAGDDDVGGGDPLVEADVFGDEVETRDQTGADRQQPAGQTAGRASAVDVLHVDAILVAVALGESPQASLQQPDLGRGRPLLRGEDAGRIDEPGAHVAGDLDLDSAEPGAAAERFDRAEPAVGGRRSAETDEHGAGALVDRLGDQFARAPGRRRERVIVLALRRRGPAHSPGPSR